MPNDGLFPVPESRQGRAWVDSAACRRAYERSLRDAGAFWAEHAARLDWIARPTVIRDVSYGPDDVHIRWFHDGALSASLNCLDRHLAARGGKTAILWEGDDPAESRALSYTELHAAVCRLADGSYWITGRVDDVINVSGHRLGTAEVESALVAHPEVAEAAVVGYPHEPKRQGIYAYVTLKSDARPSDELQRELGQWVRKEIGPIATPDLIQWAPGSPKTRSGKIMCRILRKIAANDCADLGDTSPLADPSVVESLVSDRRGAARSAAERA